MIQRSKARTQLLKVPATTGITIVGSQENKLSKSTNLYTGDWEPRNWPWESYIDVYVIGATSGLTV